LFLHTPRGEREVTITHAELASHGGGTRSVGRYLNRLEVDGYLEIISNGRIPGTPKQRPNTYRLRTVAERQTWLREQAAAVAAEVEILTVTLGQIGRQDSPEESNPSSLPDPARESARALWLPLLPSATKEIRIEMEVVPMTETRQQRRAMERAAKKAERKQRSGHMAGLETMQKQAVLTRVELDRLEERDAAYMRAAYEHLAAGRVAPSLLAELAELDDWDDEDDENEAAQARLIAAEKAIDAAVPKQEVEDFLINQRGHGRSNEWAIPNEFWWPALDLCDPGVLAAARTELAGLAAAAPASEQEELR